MKYTEDDAGRTVATSETHEEEVALQYLASHRPLFALAEPYVVSSFIAGYQAAIAEQTQAGLAAIRSQQDNDGWRHAAGGWADGRSLR